jgi:hypothetical protein
MISPLTTAAAGSGVGVGGGGVDVGVAVGWNDEITEQPVKKIRRKGKNSFRGDMGLIIPEGGKGSSWIEID